MPAPKYVRVADAIREQIRAGELRPGDRLPSTTELQRIYDCSYGPVRTALLLLKAEGLLAGEQGVGVFVAGPR